METQIRTCCSWSAYMTSQWLITQFILVLTMMVTLSLGEHGTTEISLCGMKKEYYRVVNIVKRRDQNYSIERCLCYITSKGNWKMTVDLAFTMTSSDCNEGVKASRNNRTVYHRCSNVRKTASWSNELLLNGANDEMWFEYSQREPSVFRGTAYILAKVVSASEEQVLVACNPGLTIKPRSGGPRDPRGPLPTNTPSTPRTQSTRETASTSTKSVVALTPKSRRSDVDDDKSESRLYLIIGITSALCFVGFTMAVVVGVRHKCGMRRGQDGAQVTSTAGHSVDNTYTESSSTYEELNAATANSVIPESYVSPFPPAHSYVNTNGQVGTDLSPSQPVAHAYINMQNSQSVSIQRDSENQPNGYINFPAEQSVTSASVCPNCSTNRTVGRHSTVEA